jgi:hypothetical protein
MAAVECGIIPEQIKQNSESSTAFNLGGVVTFHEQHHILFSFGRFLSGGTVLTGYIAYQLTI